MGFWDIAKSVGKAVAQSAIEDIQSKQNEVNRAYDRADRKSDEQLVNSFKNASSNYEKLGYAKALEDRGYLYKDGDGKYKRTSKTL